MIKYKFIFFFKLFLFLITINNLDAKKQDFFITKKTGKTGKKLRNMRRNTLKQEIGQKTKEALLESIKAGGEMGRIQIALARKMRLSEKKENKDKKKKDVKCGNYHVQALLTFSGNIHQEMGSIQLTLSSMQRQFSDILECLIDNKRPFKRASKQELCDVTTLMSFALSRLKKITHDCRSTSQHVNSVKPKQDFFKSTSKTLQTQNSSLKKICEQIKQNGVLKRI